MKASYNWIKEFVHVKATPQEVADRLTMAGLEIEGLKELGAGLSEVRTATVLKIEKHPNADRLSLCEVKSGDLTVNLVCGAKNMKEGDRVALALPGTTLPNGMTLKEAVIRKVKSHGMLCSESELGLAEESEGIMILPPEVPEGVPLPEALPLSDAIFEVNVTPNRGDCLSIQGLAREIAGNYHLSLKPHTVNLAGRGELVKPTVEVALQAPESCPRYSCRVVRGIKVGPAPELIRRRLESCGIRSINNIVDATNYIMLETGQPLHAFDLTEVRGQKVWIRHAAEGETMNTLDGEERRLKSSDLVIADQDRVLALAGVMGGEGSGIHEATADLLLESAHFDGSTVRQTAKRFALQTESSYRFERGVDPNGCVGVLDRLTQLILEIAGGKVVEQAVDAYPQPVHASQVTLRKSQVERVLGLPLPESEILPPLQGLGIRQVDSQGEGWQLEIPTFRSDLTREIDLIEEVARLYGYNRVPIHYPSIQVSQFPQPGGNEFDRREGLRETLKGWGFSEVIHYSFTSPELLKRFGIESAAKLKLANPLSEDLSVMRPSLLPQMAQTLRKNIHNGQNRLRLFEIRPVYGGNGGGNGMKESWRLALGLSGPRQSAHPMEPSEEVSPLDLKGPLETLFRQFGGGNLHTEPSKRPYFHPKRQAQLKVEMPDGDGPASFLGELGQLHPGFLADWDVTQPMILAEIYLDLFLTESKNSIQFQEISPFPRVDRDLNLILDEGVSHGAILSTIQEKGGPWVRKIELLDVYRGKPLEEGKKALTYRLEYGSSEKTLTDAEVNQAREKLLEALNKKLGATLR